MKNSQILQNKNISSAILYILFFCIVLLCLGFLTNLENYYKLYNNNVKGKGIVSAVLCSRHQQFKYDYQVNNVIFTGIGVAGNSCDLIKTGDFIAIFYSPKNPEISTNEDPERAFKNELIPVLLAAFIFPLLIIFSIRFYKK